MNSNSPIVPEVDVRKVVHQKSPSLLRTLFIVFGPLMSQGHLCKLFGDVMIFVGPVLQRFVSYCNVSDYLDVVVNLLTSYSIMSSRFWCSSHVP